VDIVRDILLYGIPAYIALIISLILYLQDRRRFHIPLQVRISSFVVAWNKGNQSLVLFRLICVNHSLRGLTVVRTLITPPTGITEIPFGWVYDKDYKNVVALLPNSEKSNPLPALEVLHDALDIPPHQSQSRWVGVLLQLPQKRDDETENKFVSMSFAALDVNDKFLAVLQIPVTLSQLRTVGGYPVTMMQIATSYRVYKRG
jgi:hypothetical protein